MTLPFAVGETTAAQEEVNRQPFQTKFGVEVVEMVIFNEDEKGKQKIRVPLVQFGKKLQHRITIGDVEFVPIWEPSTLNKALSDIVQRASLAARRLQQLFNDLGFDVGDPPITIRWRLDALGSLYQADRNRIVLGAMNDFDGIDLHTIAHELAHFYTDVAFNLPDAPAKTVPGFVPLAEGLAQAMAIIVDKKDAEEGAEIFVESDLKASAVFADTKGFLKMEEYWIVGFVTRALLQRGDERLVKALQTKATLTDLIDPEELDQLQQQIQTELRTELGLPPEEEKEKLPFPTDLETILLRRSKVPAVPPAIPITT